MSKHRHLFDRLRIFVSYSFVQAAGQALGFLAGILVVRTLPKEDYAWFMIVNTIAPVMNLLSDNGIGNSLAAIGGKFWQDDTRMGSLVRTAMSLRKRLVILSFFAITPILVWMLVRNHVPLTTMAWLVPLTLLGVYFQLNVGVLTAVINLRQQLGRMQSLVFAGVLPRLGLIVLFAACGLLNSPLAVAAGTVTLAVQLWLLAQWVKPQIAWHAPPDAEYKKEILSIVKRQAPLTIYFCIQSQLGLWLISIFGNVERVAEVGALGRFGMIFTVLMSTMTAVVIPRFARSQNLARLRSQYGLILLGFASLILLISAFAWLFPAPLLWLLGGQYTHLHGLVGLSVLANGLINMAGLIYFLNIYKGWIPPATVVVTAEIITQVVLCLMFDLSTVRGILMISLLAPLIPGAINLYVGIRHLRQAA